MAGRDSILLQPMSFLAITTEPTHVRIKPMTPYESEVRRALGNPGVLLWDFNDSDYTVYSPDGEEAFVFNKKAPVAGGSGVVYFCHPVTIKSDANVIVDDKSTMCLKKMQGFEDDTGSVSKESVEREAQILQLVGDSDGRSYSVLADSQQYHHLFMRNAGEQPLYQHLHGEKGKSLDDEARIKLAIQVWFRLTYCHHLNVIHRDVSSYNFMAGDDGVRLIDFGNSVRRDIPAEWEQNKSALLGNPIYNSPETHLLKGGLEEDNDELSDIYGAAVTTLEILGRIKTFNNYSITVEEVSSDKEESAIVEQWYEEKGARDLEALYLLRPNGTPYKKYWTEKNKDKTKLLLQESAVDYSNSSSMLDTFKKLHQTKKDFLEEHKNLEEDGSSSKKLKAFSEARDSRYEARRKMKQAQTQLNTVRAEIEQRKAKRLQNPFARKIQRQLVAAKKAAADAEEKFKTRSNGYSSAEKQARAVCEKRDGFWREHMDLHRVLQEQLQQEAGQVDSSDQAPFPLYQQYDDMGACALPDISYNPDSDRDLRRFVPSFTKSNDSGEDVLHAMLAAALQRNREDRKYEGENLTTRKVLNALLTHCEDQEFKDGINALLMACDQTDSKTLVRGRLAVECLEKSYLDAYIEPKFKEHLADLKDWIAKVNDEINRLEKQRHNLELNYGVGGTKWRVIKSEEQKQEKQLKRLEKEREIFLRANEPAEGDPVFDPQGNRAPNNFKELSQKIQARDRLFHDEDFAQAVYDDCELIHRRLQGELREADIRSTFGDRVNDRWQSFKQAVSYFFWHYTPFRLLVRIPVLKRPRHDIEDLPSSERAEHLSSSGFMESLQHYSTEFFDTVRQKLNGERIIPIPSMEALNDAEFKRKLKKDTILVCGSKLKGVSWAVYRYGEAGPESVDTSKIDGLDTLLNNFVNAGYTDPRELTEDAFSVIRNALLPLLSSPDTDSNRRSSREDSRSSSRSSLEASR